MTLSNIWQFNDFKKNINFLKQTKQKEKEQPFLKQS